LTFASLKKHVWLAFGWLLVGVWLVFGWLLVGVWLAFGWLLVGFWLNVNGFNMRGVKNGRFCYPFATLLLPFWFTFG